MKPINFNFHDVTSWTVNIGSKKYHTSKPIAFYLSSEMKNYSEKYPVYHSCKIELEDADKYENIISSIFKLKDFSITMENIDFLKKFCKKLKIHLFDNAFAEFDHYMDLVEISTNEDKNIKILKKMERLLLKLDIDRIDRTINAFKDDLIDETSFCKSLFSICISQPQKIDIYVALLSKCSKSIVSNFVSILFQNFNSQEVYFLAFQMITSGLLDSSYLIKNVQQLPLFFANLINSNALSIILEEDSSYEFETLTVNALSHNNWQLHKWNCLYGRNSLPIAIAIRQDNVETLQQLISISNPSKDTNIPPSVYERFSFINGEPIKLIDFAAFFGSVNCFKYLFLNGYETTPNKTFTYAICGGISEIIHMCENNNNNMNASLLASIQFHRHNLFEWLIDTKQQNYSDPNIPNIIMKYFNVTAFISLIHRGYDPNNFLLPAIHSGNLKFIAYLATIQGINFNIPDINGLLPIHHACKEGFFNIVEFLIKKCGNKFDINAKAENDMTPLHYSCMKGDDRSVSLLLEIPKIDITAKTIHL